MLAAALVGAGCGGGSATEAASRDGGPEPSDAALEPPASPACAPGLRPTLAAEGCAPVGPAACAEGFARDRAGVGCAAVLPETACEGATRTAIGETTCAPVGDCAAPFPPPGASIVDPALPDAALDATHHRTLAEALRAAPRGGTIALADGTHAGAEHVVDWPVTVVGRCPARTRLVAPAGARVGFYVLAPLTLRGLTMAPVLAPVFGSGRRAVADVSDVVLETPLHRAVVVNDGATATVRRALVRGTSRGPSDERSIAFAAGAGAELTLEDVTVVDVDEDAIAALDGAATRVTVRRTVVDGARETALRALAGGALVVEESVVRRAHGTGVFLGQPESAASTVEIARSVITGTLPRRDDLGELGFAVSAAYGTSLTLVDTTVSDTPGTGLVAARAARVVVERGAFLRAESNASVSGRGVSVLHDAEVTLRDSAIVRASGGAVGAAFGGRARVERSLLEDLGGAVVEGLETGHGLSVSFGATIDADDVAVVDARTVGVGATGPTSRLTLARSIVRHTPAVSRSSFAHALFATDGARVDVTGGALEAHAGVALFWAGGGGFVQGTLVRGNAVAVHVQEGSTLVEADAAPGEPAPAALVVARDVRFVGNAARVGAGTLPLPAVPTEAR